ncbi:MAG: divergent polysaccharide deacetylase family protein [Deltaproteobacteria bacterium]|nr:divergent polysaccharide deacetylase family protein [Deltaproteobacteria bacterium]
MPSPPPPPLVRPSTLPRVAIVIDDMGQDMKRLDEIIGVGSQITIAVLPYLQYSTETAKEAHLRGLEVILHLPMEPKGSDEHDPGKGALWTAMTPAEVRGQTEADLKAVPYADGVNNHMGSRFTEDEPLMREVMGVVKKKGIYFLDSRTTSKSVGAKAARGLGAASAGRDVFLDNERDGKSIKARIDETVRIAKKRGTAIAIGHPYPETIKALHETLPGLDGKGVVVVRLSDLVK